MNQLKNPKLYVKAALIFFVIALFDWLTKVAMGMYEGQAFAQVTDGYKLPLSFSGVAFAVAYLNLNKEKK